MLDVILNETKLLREFKNNYEFPNDIKSTDMIHILIKDYYIKGQDKEEIYTSIMNDLEEALGEEFIYTKWNRTIRIMTSAFFKFIKTNKIDTIKMHDISEIRISKSELDKIAKLNNSVLEKLSFILLIYAKISHLQNPKTYQEVKEGDKRKKVDYWVNQSFTTIFKEAKVGLKGDSQKIKMNELYNKKYIGMSRMNDKTSIKVNYADETIIENDEDLVITDFDGVVYQYLIWKGEKWKRCEDCGKWIRLKKQSSQKYCSVCKNKKQLEWNNNYRKNK